MGDMGIDKWCWKMAEHKRKGHQIIKYPGMEKYSGREVKKSADDIKKDIFLKHQRAAFWEKHHRIPATNDLIFGWDGE